ncbi:4Fe-4S cluster-binding domain-containing protein [Bacteroides eggerthii]|jgi:pyruvate formate lyase activating enzyme|uniref:4Fe-4S cluster-binding domain-containing protein n=1 Tax=Bacteroides eggerthii TaxID=28111 RepID=UPI0022E98D38|nr:4Fe-4S cluster-binding domain-containing protein [Bacteroides eggerthii]
MNVLDVTSIQRECIYDGPGIRTTVFLRGCIFHCPWCCNPETISKEAQFIDNERCIKLKGIKSVICQNCERYGGHSKIAECPFGVTQPISHYYDTDTLFEILLKDEKLYNLSEGGITFSGGEPLLWAKELKPLLQRIKSKKISIYIETTLASQPNDVLMLLPYIDGFYIDLKLQDENNPTNAYINNVCKCLELIKNTEKKIIFRLVFVKSLLLNTNVIQILHKLNVKNIELLKCHNLGAKKYIKLGLQNKDFTPNQNDFITFSKRIEKEGISVSLLSI